MRRRISIRGRVRPSVGPFVRRSVCPALFSKVKKMHTRRILCRVSGLVLFLISSQVARQIAFFGNDALEGNHAQAIQVTSKRLMRTFVTRKLKSNLSTAGL